MSFLWLATILSSVFIATVGSNPVDSAAAAAEVELYVGISSLASVKDGHIVERQIEVSWRGSPSSIQPGDRIELYQYLSESSYCQSSTGSALVESVPAREDESWVRLNTSIPYFTEGGLVDESCQMFWAGYVRQDGSLVGCGCIRAQPNWMWNLRDRIGGVKLREVFLPGTHDSGAYAVYNGTISNNPATKYAVAQGENLYNQLAMGIRYLDIRILFRPNNEEARFWTIHGSYIFRPLIEDTTLVREFMTRTNEIVIFDIHGLEGMDQDPNSHAELHDFLYSEFGPFMAPQVLTWDATLADFWGINKRLVVTYNDPAGNGVSYLWRAVAHQWGNVNELDNLHTYLQSVMDKAAAGQLEIAWSAMAELTPSTVDVMTDRLDGLRGAADIVNRNVTIWFRDEGWAEYPAIVATDFFYGNDIINVAIQENMRRYP